MPTIAAKWVKARDWHQCADCWKMIAPGTTYARAYGYAHRHERPWVIRVHKECAMTEVREKAGSAP